MAELGFDTQQRFEAIESVLNDLGLHYGEPENGGHHVLDVGGYPGTLADYLAPDLSVQTVDQPPCDRPDYTQASGTELPFDDASFPLVLASDTLEHIPFDDREKFVREMVRVAQRYVLIAGPLKSAPVDRAERALVKFYERTFGRSHRWLAEHRAFGLPRVDRLMKWMSPHGSIAVRSNGYLPDWTLLMGMTFLDEHLAAPTEGFKNPGESLGERYRQLRERHGPDDARPAYRHLILLDKEGTPAASPEEAMQAFPEECIADYEPAEIRFLLKLQIALIYGVAERFGPRAELGEAGIEKGYAEQLERALKLAETENERLRSEAGDVPTKRRPKRFLWFLGRRGE